MKRALLTSGATRVMRASSAFYIAFGILISRIWSAPHLYNIRVTFAQHSHSIRNISAWHSRVITAFDTRFRKRLLRVCCPLMYCRCFALLARRKCAGPRVTFGQYCTLRIVMTSPLNWPNHVKKRIFANLFNNTGINHLISLANLKSVHSQNVW
jgi:hypothetical protein